MTKHGSTTLIHPAASLKVSLMVLLCLLANTGLSAALNPSKNSFVDGEYTTEQFQAIPPFTERATGKPSVVLAFDISGTMLVPAYPENGKNWSNDTLSNFDPNRIYFGYFESNTQYRYDMANGFFTADENGAWNGDFLNWLTMRRVDVARKVMIDGKVRDRDGELINGVKTWVLEGEKEIIGSDDFTKRYASSSRVSPIADNTPLRIADGQIQLQNSTGSDGVAVTVNNKLEIGYIETNWDQRDQFDPSNWPQVSYLNTYNEPVVVVGTLTFAGFNATTVVATNVTTSNFKIGMTEWDAWDGGHTTERMIYVVAEAGEHTISMADGSEVTFIAGKETSIGSTYTLGESAALNTTTGKQICYKPTCTSISAFGTAPVVLAGVSTFNDTTDIPSVRAFSINATRFHAVLQEEEGADQTRSANEDIHFIAFEKTAGATASGAIIQTGIFEDVGGADRNSGAESFAANTFSETPLVAFSQQTANDASPSSIRIGNESGSVTSGQSKDNIVVSVQDSTTSNYNNHELEDVGFLAVQGNDSFNIQVALTSAPENGLVQENRSSVNFGLTVYNFDHKEDNANNIVTGNKTHGQTMYPCYWIYDNYRRAARVAEAATDPYMNIETVTLYNGSSRDYLCIPTSVHAPNEKIVQVIEEYPLIWGTTPIAESLVDVGRMVRQEPPHYYWDVSNSPYSSSDNRDRITNDPRGVFGVDKTGVDTYGFQWDPYFDTFHNDALQCKKIFVLHFNDGAPYKDFDNEEGVDPHTAVKSTPLWANIPNDNEGDQDELDSVALALRQNDCRADLPGHQEVISYFVYAALGQDEQSNTSTRRMREAAARGGFFDEDGDHQPDPMWPEDADGTSYTDFNTYAALSPEQCPESEWDADGNCEPDTFFLATDGAQIKTKLQGAIDSILARVSSGGAASVVSASSSGTGAVYQANFTPVLDGITWYGDVYATMVDNQGLTRDDSNGNGTLDPTDKYVDTCYNPSAKEVWVKLSNTPDDRPTLAQTNDCDASIFNKALSDVTQLWSAATELAAIPNSDIETQRDYTSTDNLRHIITAFHTLDGSGADDGLITADDVQPFVAASFEQADENNIGLLDAGSDSEAANIVNFIRGEEITGYRTRLLDDTMQRLGDVIYSTPTAVSRPAEIFHERYQDATYRNFLDAYLNRRTVIYAGGNDGMLHAFNAGWVTEKLIPDSNPPQYTYEFSTQFEEPGGTLRGVNWALGQEMWAYVPYNLLPHLKHLTNADYGKAEGDHLYFVDAQARVFDARIFSTGSGTVVTGGFSGGQTNAHVDGWGTLMVVGFRLGGSDTTVVNNPNDAAADHIESAVRPAYVIFDITDPEQPPKLLLEFSHEKLGHSLSTPAPLTVNDGQDWYLLFGSGPTASPDGFEQVKSEQNAHLFLLDLKTMTLETSFGSNGVWDTGQANAFVGDMIATDWDADYSAVAVYFGITTALDQPADGLGASDADGLVDDWGGKMMRLRVNDATAPGRWTVAALLDTGEPVMASPSTSFDSRGNRWIHFGTGRFFTEYDSLDASVQAIYGLKEPRAFNTDGDFNWDPIDPSILLDVTDFSVALDSGELTGATLSPALPSNTVQALENRMIGFGDSSTYLSGWKKEIPAGERILGEAALLGAFMFSTSFSPSLIPCDFSGQSNLYGLRFTTGTAWYKTVIGSEDDSDGSDAAGDNPPVLDRVQIGKTPAKTPSLHRGSGNSEGEISIFTQKADTSILRLEGQNLEGINDGETSWREY